MKLTLENIFILKFIDATVATTGEIKTRDLRKAFSIGKTSSVKMINLYKEAQPGNLRMIESGRYSKTTTFTPRFLGSTEPAEFLAWLDILRSPFVFDRKEQAPEWCYQNKVA
ncbi:hypothetical protein FWP33_26005 [Vibrio parahaemolyticus]|jgi:hypothetical protein|uniref:DNA-binding transcriptional repressor CapW winged helix-turn-helix domain-containing protein n=2 Tax=Vibrio harveyi group TaxID=717610 RepID=A0A9Q3YHR3_VIBPH|nr:hypothetical protein [Vibrio parahaemolyticus]ELA8176745.1 hypothetical protein [Vibrio alginolyticus]CAH1598889.1 hypothetical protein THF1C08_50297 [Vibrio jasicida]EGQ9745946.1 hypothetical protein [Vibrio parahaemolyticus]EJC7176184.1 hypothetical protein [Vibrio parahaemolyticus]EJE4724623.1 hypothetical protein [Vibrio parahaemolyticus]